MINCPQSTAPQEFFKMEGGENPNLPIISPSGHFGKDEKND